jgi:nucleoside phosphorylase
MASTAFNEKFVLLAGSASTSCSAAKLNRAHAVVRELTHRILELGGGFVLFASAEPTIDDGSTTPLIFDWAVLREIDRCLAGSSAPARRCVSVVTSHKAWSSKMTDTHRQILARLSGSGAAEIVYVDSDVHTGGNIGDEQVQRADAMIAIAGGKGVADRAHKMMRKGCPVLPLDISLGSLSDDGEGALGLHKKLLSEPHRLFPNTHASIRSQIPALSLELDGSDPRAVANRAVDAIGAELAAARANGPIEVVVLTALAIELAAVKCALGLTAESPSMKMSSGTLYWTTEVDGRQSGRSHRVATVCIGGAGNVDAAVAVTEIVAALKPKLLIMVGIAAGIRGKCRLGEVVFSERVVAYEPAAAVVVDGTSTELARPESFKLAHTIQQDVVAYLADGALTERLLNQGAAAGITIPPDVASEMVAQGLTVRSATIASGDKLLRDPEKFQALRAIHGKIEVGEMEAAGVAAACHRAGAHFLIVRGISDFGDDAKDDRFHNVAATAAAVVAADFLTEGLRLAP